MLGSSSRDQREEPLLDHDRDGPPQLRTSRLLVVVLAVVCGSSVQFGYGQAVLTNLEQLGPASLGESSHFALWHWSLIVSGFGLGGALGSALSSVLLSLSRRTALMLTSMIVMCSSAMLINGRSWLTLFAGRVLSGAVVSSPRRAHRTTEASLLACLHTPHALVTLSQCTTLTRACVLDCAHVQAGITAGLVPLYFAEIAPLSLRSTLATSHQLGISLGCVASLVLTTPELLGSPTLWRYAFLIPAGLAAAQCLALPIYPEPSASVLAFGPERAALASLSELHASSSSGSLQSQARRAAEAAAEDWPGEPLSISELLGTRSLRRQMAIGLTLLLAMQLCGIDAIVCYSTRVLRVGGLHQPQIASALLGVCNVPLTLFAVCLMDKFGRRTLLLVSWGGMCTSYVVVASCLTYMSYQSRASAAAADAAAAAGAATGPDELDGLEFEQVRSVCVAGLVGVLAFFAVGPGSVAWFAIAEIFPAHARDAALSLGVTVNWLANFGVLLAFPLVLEPLGPLTLYLFALSTFCLGCFTYRYVPETRERTIGSVTAMIDAIE